MNATTRRAQRTLAATGRRLAFALLLLAGGASRLPASLYTVTNVDDSGNGSLRKAITDANADASSPHSIVISIAGSGPHTVALATALPTITRPTAITAIAEANGSVPGVTLDGSGVAAAGADGLSFGSNADGSSVAYLAIVHFSGDGIQIASDSTSVSNCYLGITINGTTPGGNGGAGINGLGSLLTIGSGTATRNVISGNAGNGITLAGTAGFSVVRGNRIGTNAAGTGAVANGGAGVSYSASGVSVGGNGAGEGNLISGNGGYGVSVNSGSAISGVQGNIIGLDAAGTSAIANGSGGIWVTGDNALIGSTDPAGRNVIAGNNGAGIFVFNGADSTQVRGNYIGTNAAGDAVVAGQTSGLRITGTATNCTIGGDGASYRNVISGHSNAGVAIETDVTGCVVSGNYIGTNAAGSASITTGGGVALGGTNNTLGGDSAGERNVISGNPFGGVALYGSDNRVQGNYIGTDPTGTAAVANGFHGIRAITATLAQIGGTGAGEGNLISGNDGPGITLDGDTSGIVIAGNRVGTDAGGTAALPNGSGIGVNGTGHTVGGSTAAARNLVSGNTGNGISLAGSDHAVKGCFVGTNASGDGALANGANGIQIYSGTGIQIGGSGAGEGNLVSGNSQRGIAIDGSGITVLGNRVGTNLAGTAAVGNGGTGIRVYSGPGIQVGGGGAGEGNLVSGNGQGGIAITASNSAVRGNKVGTDLAGTAAIGNSGNGIQIYSGTGTEIGGTSAGQGNLVSGNSQRGMSIDGSGNTVRGNKVGTNLAGTAALGNGSGVSIYGSGHTIGGNVAAARNLVSGNAGGGFYVTGSGHVISGNYVGTTADGTTALGNGSYGLRADTIDNVTIGGNTVADGNVFAGNTRGVNLGYGSHDNQILNNVIGLNAAMTTDLADSGTGIEIADSWDNQIGLPGKGNVIAGMSHQGIRFQGDDAHGNQVQGNWIGTNKVGATTLGNDFAGVFIADSSGNRIGGTGAGEGNVIAHNYQFGVRVDRGEKIEIAGNSIFGNYFGIDLDELGFFPNDAGDGDVGGNRVQNYPLLASALVDGGATDVEGLLVSAPDTEYRIEFFSGPTCGNAGFGEGRNFRGSTQVTTDGSGQAAIAHALPLAVPDAYLTATATDPDGNTSEFSPCAQVDLAPNPGTFQFDRVAYVGYEGVLPTTKVFVTRSLGLSGTATVDFTTSNLSATAGSDYTDSDQTLTFQPWEVVKIVEVPILYDPAAEPFEKLALALASPSAGAALGSPVAGEIQIYDYTPADPGLTVDDAAIVEGDSGQDLMVFQVHLSPTDHQVQVTFLTEPATAKPGEDYVELEEVITFPASGAPQTIEVEIPILGDTEVEPDEYFWLRITSAENGGNWIAYDTYGRGAIENDDTGAPSSVIFLDDFEVGDLSNWSDSLP